jgi:lysozyme family protein
MTDITAIKRANQARWDGATLTRASEFTKVAQRLINQTVIMDGVNRTAKSIYQEIEQATGVPWFIIAVIHEREASQMFTAQLGQGDPLAHVSTHVPKGRGPFVGPKAFVRGAIDALVNCQPYAARWKDWTPGGALTLLEEYNGLGYEGHHEASPYVWAGTSAQQPGKYTGDGHFDPSAWDKQLGCAGLLKAMMALDLSIKFGAPVALGESPAAPTPAPAPKVPTSPKPTTATPKAPAPPAPKPVPAKTSWLGSLFGALAAIFKRKPD